MRLWNHKLFFFRSIHNSDMFFLYAAIMTITLRKELEQLHGSLFKKIQTCTRLTIGRTIALRAAPARHLGAVHLWVCVASLRSHVNCHWLDISCAFCPTNNSEGNWRQTQNWPAPCNRSVNGSIPVPDCLFHLPLQLLQLFSWLWWSFEPQITTLHQLTFQFSYNLPWVVTSHEKKNRCNSEIGELHFLVEVLFCKRVGSLHFYWVENQSILNQMWNLGDGFLSNEGTLQFEVFEKYKVEYRLQIA